MYRINITFLTNSLEVWLSNLLNSEKIHFNKISQNKKYIFEREECELEEFFIVFSCSLEKLELIKEELLRVKGFSLIIEEVKNTNQTLF